MGFFRSYSSRFLVVQGLGPGLPPEAKLGTCTASFFLALKASEQLQ